MALPMAGPLLVRFGQPEAGWLVIELLTQDATVDADMSDGLRDDLRGLVLAVRQALEGWPRAEATFYEEPAGFSLVFAKQGETNVKLTATRFRDYHNRSRRSGDVLLELVGPTVEICAAFWTGLSELESRVQPNGPDDAWGHPFPTTELAALGASLRDKTK